MTASVGGDATASSGDGAASNGSIGAASSPSAVALMLGACLAATQGLWSLFQWTQLQAARTGGHAFCGLLGDPGERTSTEACSAIFSTELATSVQAVSGLPIAGWGVVWSVVAFALPMWALAQRARGSGRRAAIGSANIVVALGGVAALTWLALDAPAALERCGACLMSYALTLSYALVVLVDRPPDWSTSLARGVSLASFSLALAYVLLFIPGLRTPQEDTFPSRYARELDAEARQRRAEQNIKDIGLVLKQLRGRRLEDFVRALDDYRHAPVLPLREPRLLVGAPNAPVRITQFTSLNCPNCAKLFTTLRRMRSSVPPRSFSIEPRHFPLDVECNAHFAAAAPEGELDALDAEGGPPKTIRCLAARIEMCLAEHADIDDFTASLYRRMRYLDEEGLYHLAEPFASREELEACVTSPETERALQQDIAWAAEYQFEGAPLVLMNGRPVPPMGPLLYTLILAEGDPYHSAFATLPAPVPEPAPEDDGAPAETDDSETDAAEPGEPVSGT